MGKELYNFFFKSVLTEQEKLKLKSFNLFKENKNNKNIINNSNVDSNSNNKQNHNINENKIINNLFFNTSIVSNINSTTIKSIVNDDNNKDEKKVNLISCNQINFDLLKK